VFLGEGHGCIEADNGKVARYMQDRLDDASRTSPWSNPIAQYRSMEMRCRRCHVDIMCFAGCAVDPFKYDGRIRVIVIMILKENTARESSERSSLLKV